MNEKEIAILGVLAITMIGAGIAFVYFGTNIGVMITGENETVPRLTETPSKPSEIIIGKNDTGEIPELTEEQKEKAKEIALSDPEVKKIVEGKRYEIKVTPMIMTVINGETKKTTKISVTVTPHHLGNKFNSSFSSSSLTFFGTSDISSLSPYSTL